MSRMCAVKKTNPQTWTNLHSRLRATPFDYCSLFPSRVADFFSDHAAAISTCDGYLLDSILTASCFVIGQNNKVSYNGVCVKPNLYLIFVGPPSTGKSQAIQIGVLEPLQDLAERRDHSSYILSKSTSAGLMQRLVEGDAMIVSSELYDIINRMAKGDSDTCSGDISMLCNLFSGEKVSCTLASQKSREIDTDRAFCILGALQPYPAAQLFTTLDVGNGFIERLILHFPNCLRPSPATTREARARLAGKPSVLQVFQAVEQVCPSNQTFTFDEEAQMELDSLNETYIESINRAIEEGDTPPQSKKIDQIMRLAVPIHVLTSVVEELLSGRQPSSPLTTIPKSSLDAAVKYVNFCESQKDTFFHELREISTIAVTPEKVQPSKEQVKAAIIKTAGPVISYRSFKSSCSKSMRSVSHAEFERAMGEMTNIITPQSCRLVTGNRKQFLVYIKKAADDVEWANVHAVSREEFEQTYKKKCPASITLPMKEALIEAGFFTATVLF